MNQDELLERFISNQRKTRGLIAVFVFVFIGFTIVTMRFANRVNEQDKRLIAQADSLKEKQEQISKLEITNIELEKTLKETAAKQDSVTAVIKQKAQASGDTKSINELKTLQQDIREQIQILDKNPTIAYIHFNSKTSKASAIQLQKLLMERGYRVPDPEKVDERYNSSIRYFHQSDEEKAYEVLRLFKESDLMSGHQPKLQQIKMSAPTNQIEIWLSE